MRPGSGGSGLSLRSDDLDSVGELYTEDNFRQLVMAAQTIPTFLCGLCQLVDHSESGLVGKTSPRSDGSMPISIPPDSTRKVGEVQWPLCRGHWGGTFRKCDGEKP